MATVSPCWEDNIAFEACCSFFEKTVTEKDKKRRDTKLRHFLRDCRNICQKFGNAQSSLYPIMRLLVPVLDKERGAYGIKETMLAKLYIDMLGLGPTSLDAMRLKNYRSNANNSKSEAGDFAAVLFSVIKDRQYSGAGINVSELNKSLDDIVSVNATKGRIGVEGILKSLFRKMNSVQQKWMVRIILKDVKFGLGEKTILKCFHPDAEDFHNINANLRKVCETLKDPNVRQNEMDIVIFSPFKPMLADRKSVVNIMKIFNTKEFFIEVKYDGERMQLHKSGSDFKFFSRNSFDFTDDFGHSAKCRDKFAYFIAQSLDGSVKDVILDGEICAYNHQTNTTTQKGEQMNIRSIGNDHPMFQQCLYVYDIIYLNGEVLSNKPLKERLQVLGKIVNEIKGRVHFAERKIGQTKKEIVDSLNNAIDRRDEGIVIKDPDSVYKPSARSKGGWFKLKPEYSGSLMDQCDLIIMGGYFGSGKRGGMITHFLLGLAASDTKNDEEQIFHSFTRVGSGYSMAELYHLLQKLQPNFRKNSKQSTSVRGLNFVLEFGREKPDVYIDPKKSVILQVKAAEIVSSDTYKTKCTLRFPRVEKVRNDKSWSECMSVQEMKDLRQQGEGKLFNRHMDLNHGEDQDDVDGPRAKRMRRNFEIRPSGVSQLYKSTATDVMIETHSLKDKVIVIEPCDAKMKAEFEKVVLKHGGKCEQNVRSGITSCYVETGYKFRARSVAKSQRVDVIKSRWLSDCKYKFRNYGPSDMIYATPETARKFRQMYDMFDDGYTEKTTLESLKHSMNKVVELKMAAKMSPSEIAEFEEEYLSPDYPYKRGLFRNMVVYCDKLKNKEDASHLEAIGIDLAFYGASLVKSLDTEEIPVTHVILKEKKLENLSQLKQNRRNRRRKYYIVTDSWVKACLQSDQLVPEERFSL